MAMMWLCILNTRFPDYELASLGINERTQQVAAKNFAHDCLRCLRRSIKPPICKWWLSPIPTTLPAPCSPKMTWLNSSKGAIRGVGGDWWSLHRICTNAQPCRFDPRVTMSFMLRSFFKVYGLAALRIGLYSEQRKRIAEILNYTRQSSLIPVHWRMPPQQRLKTNILLTNIWRFNHEQNKPLDGLDRLRCRHAKSAPTLWWSMSERWHGHLPNLDWAKVW